ncbi:MAG: ATP-binding protein, partial [Bacteroidales bacterium]|nr:ATP-binding protein [Bacteroidales bacterium]
HKEKGRGRKKGNNVVKLFNYLYKSANLFIVENNQLKFKSQYFNFEIYEGIKYILADYFRKKHAHNSRNIINNPEKELSLLSPRGVIPERIFNILGEISACHTKDFSDVMKLPFSQVGIGTENAHPRFIACLLRIGDLLDIDNNRFSDVILKTLVNIPVDTLMHKSKHLSIKSYRADSSKIEIIAKCDDYNVANITNQWFEYINNEISKQMIKWNEIVPDNSFGYLPTIGNLKVELENYEYIDSKKKPKFKVDTDKAMELLQGAGLYDSDYQSLREILQNSVDATLIRIWLENKKDKNFETPQSTDYRNLLKDYPVEIKIKTLGKVGIWQNWEIEICDNGIGISIDDLKYLMNTGSSSRNTRKNNVIEQMPVWMKPSGIFGIGFQSIFMLTDCVRIETKSYFDEKLHLFELYSPNSNRKGDILIKKKETNHSYKPGTKLKFKYKTPAVPDRYSIPSKHQNASRVAHNYDPFSYDSMDIEFAKIIDEVFIFKNKSVIPIKLSIDNDDLTPILKKEIEFKYFDKETSIEMNVWPGDLAYEFRTDYYYKNQPIKELFHLKFIGFEFNIHSDKASKVLSLNRNKIRSEYRNKLTENIYKAVFNVLTKHFNDIFSNDEDKKKDKELKYIGSMFLNFYTDREKFINFNIKDYNQWEKIPIPVNDGKDDIGMKELLEESKQLTIKYLKIGDNIDTYKFEDKKLEISIKGEEPKYNYTKFLFSKVNEYFRCITRKHDAKINATVHSYFKNNECSPFYSYDIKLILRNIKEGYHSNARLFIPCLEKFKELKLKENAKKPYVFNYNLDNKILFSISMMLSPYIRIEKGYRDAKLEVNLNDKVFEWVYENRYDKKVTMQQIKNTYQKLINSIDLEEINRSNH